MIIIFVGGGDVIVWVKLPSFTGHLPVWRHFTFPRNLHPVDDYINRKVMTLPPQNQWWYWEYWFVISLCTLWRFQFKFISPSSFIDLQKLLLFEQIIPSDLLTPQNAAPSEHHLKLVQCQQELSQCQSSLAQVSHYIFKVFDKVHSLMYAYHVILSGLVCTRYLY